MARDQLANGRQIPICMTARLSCIQGMRLPIAREAPQSLVGELALIRRSGLIERDKVAEIGKRVLLQAYRLGESEGHLLRQVALSVHDELQVIRRPQTSAMTERPERHRGSRCSVLRVVGTQECPVVSVLEYVGDHA